MGIIYENENTNVGGRKILENLQGYQSTTGEGDDKTFTEKAVVGDQLTIERLLQIIFQALGAFDPEERFEGIHCEVADFHFDMKIMQVTNLYLQRF